MHFLFFFFIIFILKGHMFQIPIGNLTEYLRTFIDKDTYHNETWNIWCKIKMDFWLLFGHILNPENFMKVP